MTDTDESRANAPKLADYTRPLREITVPLRDATFADVTAPFADTPGTFEDVTTTTRQDNDAEPDHDPE